MSESSDRFAPPGAIWVCLACGKTSRDQYGIEGTHSPGWDESCMLNSMLCEEATMSRAPSGLISVTPFGQSQHRPVFDAAANLDEVLNELSTRRTTSGN